MKKWLKRAALVVAALALLAVAAAGAGLWAVRTEGGTAWLMGRLLAAAPQVSVERVRGTLLDRLVLEGVRFRTELDELEIDSLALELDAGALFAGTLAVERADATRAAYRRLPGIAPAGGGPPELPWPLEIRAASVAELSIEVAGQTVVLRSTSASAAYDGPRLTLTDFATTYGETALAADAAIDLGGGIGLDLRAEWSGPLAGVAAAGALELRGTWPALTIRHELAAPFAATTTGTVDAAALVVDVVTEWRDLAWPGVAGVASPSGRLALAGSADDYRYDADGTVDLAGRAARFAAAGTGARLALAVERLELAPAAPGSGTLTAAGTVNLETRAADVDVAASGFDPAWVAAAWAGRLDGTAHVAAAVAGEPTVTLEAIDLAGELRGYAIAIAGAASLTGRDRVRLDELRLTSNDNRAVLSGTLDSANIDLAVAAERIALDLVLPGTGGALTADVAVTGTWREPMARGRVELRDAAVAGVTVERLEANGELGLAPTAPVALTLAATGVARGSIGARTVDAAVDGTTAEHRARVAIAAEGYAATLTATGGLVDGAWRGTLDALDVDEQVLGPWQLESPAELGFGRGSVSLGTACLRHRSDARWCAELDLNGVPEDRLVVFSQNFDLAALRPLLPGELELAGVYQLSGALFDLMGNPRGAVALTGGTTRVRVAFGDEQAFATELTRVDAGMTLTTDGRLELTAAVRNAGGGSVDVDAAVADVRAGDSPIDGELRVAWPDLGFLTLLSPELGEVEGAITAELDVAGTVAEPTVGGRAGLANGRVVVPRWGLVVDAIEATAASGDGRSLSIDATGRAGDGTLTLSGTTELDPAAGWPTRLALRGDSVLAVQRPDAEIYASPNLDVAVKLPRLDVTGTVHVPRARITIEGLPAQAVTPSRDAVVHGLAERAARVRRPLELNTAIELTLGDDVRYTGLNLDTTVSGALSLTTRPNESANATGTLSLTGTYDAYGQQLMLEDGQLLFNGPLADPGLDVRAVRTFEGELGQAETEVGIELTGTLREPRTRVFSRPALNEADALSYLLFARPASGSNAGLGTEETSTLQTAALSLGLQQALPVVQRIGDTLGLDELTVRSTATDAGALMAGKYLSPKLYIRYSYGLFNRIGGLLLRFRVNERLSIETRSGEQKSMDLLYTVEKE